MKPGKRLSYLAPLALAALAYGETVSYYIGVDGQAVIPSGEYAGLSNPNANRLTLLFAHVYDETPASNHYHSKGRIEYTGPVLGGSTQTRVNSSNYLPEGDHLPLVLTHGEGIYHDRLVSRPYTDHDDPAYAFSFLEMRPVDDLAEYPTGSSEAMLYHSSGGRWITQLAGADLRLELVDLAEGLYVGSPESLSIGLDQPGDMLALGDTFAFTPHFHTDHDAEAGLYTASFMLHDANGLFLDSGVFEFRFEVIPHREELREGHMELSIQHDSEQGLRLVISPEGHGHGDAHEAEYLPLSHGLIVAGPKAARETEDGDSWRFQGPQESFIYVLPQAQVAGLPFLGFSSEAVGAGEFLGDITVSLDSVHGPGDFHVYQVDAVGQPIRLLSSNEAPESFILPTGAHTHMNWAFTQPGDYTVNFKLSATLANSSEVESELQSVHFRVTGLPAYVHEGHADIGLHYDAGHGLAFLVAAEEEHDHEPHAEDDHHHHEWLHPADAVILLGGYAVQTISDDAALAFLGAPGSTVFMIRQQPDEGVPFLGWNTEALDASAFQSEVVIELIDVTGPGDVFLYTVDALGEVDLHWDSGSQEHRTYALPVGTHRHPNLAFSAEGTYTLTLRAHADLADASEAHAHTVLTVQVGGMEGFYGHFEQATPSWIRAETGGWFYTREWPWVWSYDEGDWLYTWGHGGPNHYYYALNTNNWKWTNPETFPWVWNWEGNYWHIWGN